MFKHWFIWHCNVHSRVTLERLQAGKEYTKLNQFTIRLYHMFHGTGK